MRVRFAVFGLLLVALAFPARAQELIDENTDTQCHGTRCIGQYCTQDGDARYCWKESVLIRKPGEEVHWVCTRHRHKCSWVHGPVPEGPDWNKFVLEP